MERNEEELVSRYLSGEATAEEVARLDARLREDPELRAAFVRQGNVVSAVEVDIDASESLARSDTVVRVAPGRSRAEPRSWMSAAALIAVGLFAGCIVTGVAWAYAKADAGVSFRLPVALFDGGFETEATSAAAGYPTGPGSWSGDQVEVVTSGHQGVTSFEGQRMLRFVQTWGDEPEKIGARSNQWQIVDLSGVDTGDGKLLATLRAHFNRIDAGPDTDTVFRIEVQAFNGDPATVESQYDSEAYLSGAVLKKRSDGDPKTWEELEVTTSVPPEADFLLIGFYAHEDVVDDPPTEPEFAGHYVDGVELELVSIK